MANASRIGSGALTGAAAGTAIAPGLGTAVGGGAGALLGLLSGGDNSDQIRQNIQNALNEYTNIGLPPDLSLPIIYQQLQQSGQLTPALETALQEEMFNAQQVKEPEEDRTALLSALNQMRSQTFGGLTPEQQANQQKLLNQTNASTQSNIKGILQGQQQRGQINAGDTLAAQLNAAQSGAQRNSENALQIGAQGADAQRQALSALLSGQSQLRQQDIGKEQANASLRQQADMWKAQNASGRQARNIGATNDFNVRNWDQQNKTNLYNTVINNQELLRQREAQNTNWNNKLNLAKAKAGAYTGNANYLSDMDANSNQSFNNLMQSITAGAGAYSQGMRNQPNTAQEAAKKNNDTLTSSFTADPYAGIDDEPYGNGNNYSPTGYSYNRG